MAISAEQIRRLHMQRAEIDARLYKERMKLNELDGAYYKARGKQHRKLERKVRFSDLRVRKLSHQRSEIDKIIFPRSGLNVYSELRGLRDHHAFFGVDFVGKIAQILVRKKASGQQPIAHVCDISLGQGRVVYQLKNIFGDSIITHGTTLDPVTNPKYLAGIDTIHQGDVLLAKSSYRLSPEQYDLIFSRKGPWLGTSFTTLKAVVLSKLAPAGQAFIEFNERDFTGIKKLIDRTNQVPLTSMEPRYSADLYVATEHGRREKKRVPTLQILRLN